jgi:CRP-like cAMP-binding protein
MSQLFFDNIEKHIFLSEEEKTVVLSLFQKQKIYKKNYFLQEGDICKSSAFVVSGCVRSYFVDTNGFEHILQFAIEDWWITDMMSVISQTPANLNIDAVEDSELLILTRENQLKLFELFPKFEKYFRIITEKGMANIQTRLLENMSLPAKERYKNLIKKYPKIVEKVPQKQIASFLGITPEFLSKIRHQMAFEKK